MSIKPTFAGLEEEVRLMGLDFDERGEPGLTLNEWIDKRLRDAAHKPHGETTNAR